MYQTAFQSPLSNANLTAQSGKDQITIANQKAAQSAANYQQYQRHDGGYGFLDPTGKEISASDYAAATGKTPQDVLKGSQNPVDIQYLQDYNNLQSLLQAVTTGDKTTAQKFYDLNPGLQKLKPNEVIQKFQQAYPTVYGFNKPGVPLGQTNIPTVSDSSSPLDSLLAQYGVTAGQ